MNKAKPDLHTIKQQIQKAGAVQKNRPEYTAPEKSKPFEEVDIRPTQLVPKKINTLVSWAVFAVALIVYMLTQARSLSFWDSGEYATCISILGVPHPPGNPFYILFGRSLVTLFGGLVSHATIAAFISAVTSAFAVMFTYLITVQLVSMFKVKYWEAVFAGVLAALFTAFSFTFWMNAVEAEVYSGLVFFVNLIIWLTLYWVQHSRDFKNQNYLLLILYLFFLGFSVHQTALQIAPAILMIALYPLFIQGAKKGTFWYKFFGYGAVMIFAYIIFGAIGKGLKIDAFDQIGFGVSVLVLMVLELRKIIDARVWFLGFLLILIGISAHIYLPIRAADRPFINLADPSTSKRFDDYIQRRQYKSEQETSMFDRRGDLVKHQFGFHFLRYFGWQWFKPDAMQRLFHIPKVVSAVFGGLLVAFLGLFGAVFHARKNKHSFIYFLAIMLCTTVLMVWVMNLSNEEVRDRDYFFVVAYNMWAIWLGIGALATIHFLKGKVMRLSIVAVLTLLPILNMAAQYYEHDRSSELVALDYGVNILNSLEENAIIFTNGDNDTYPLWYAQALHDPKAKEFKGHKVNNVYPTEESKNAMAKAMEYKNTYLKGIRKDVTIANLSLLNTSWYIRQLRDKEGVLFDWTEDQINLFDQRTYESVNALRPSKVDYKAGDPQNEIQFSMQYASPGEESSDFAPDKFSDVAVIDIVKNNFGKRPIYFAVTCESNVGFDPYLINQGMVNRIIHTAGEYEQQMDIERILTNIDKVYQYRSIFDDNVYKDDNMKRLIVNYGAAYNRAAIHYTKERNFAKALEYSKTAKKFMGDNYEMKMLDFYTRYYAATENFKELDRFIDSYVFPMEDTSKDSSPYNKYVLLPIAEEQPDMIGEYLAKALKRYEDSERYLFLAYHYASKFGLKPNIDAVFSSMGATLTSKWNEAYQYFSNPSLGDSLASEEEQAQQAG